MYSDEGGGSLQSTHVRVAQVSGSGSVYVAESDLPQDSHLTARVLFNSTEITQTNFCEDQFMSDMLLLSTLPSKVLLIQKQLLWVFLIQKQLLWMLTYMVIKHGAR